MKLGEFLFGKEASTKKRSFQTPQQQNLMNMILGQLSGQGGGANQALSLLQQFLQPGQEGFDEFSQPYIQQFNQEVLPGIAERFAGGGALSSSGFAQALGGARSGLQSQLAQLYGNRQQNAINSLLGLGQNLLGQQTFGFEQRQAEPGYLTTIGASFAEGLGKSANPASMGR